MFVRRLVLLVLLPFPGIAQIPPETGRFFEARQPFFQTQVDVAAAPAYDMSEPNFVVRGILIPLAPDLAVVFDQELLRVAGVWIVPLEHPPVTLQTMAQMTYNVRRRRAYDDHPRPTGPVVVKTRMHPGVAHSIAELLEDPRPLAREGDHGRGPLPPERARFEGLELTPNGPVVRYRLGDTTVHEWYESRFVQGRLMLLRHLEVGPHAQPLLFALGQSNPATRAMGAPSGFAQVRFTSNSEEVALSEQHGETIATVPPSAQLQRFTLATLFSAGRRPTADAQASSPPVVLEPTPARPTQTAPRLWPETATSVAELSVLNQNGLELDRISVPEQNPWNRRVRVSDLAFLNEDRAAVVTYDGDVWIVDGLASPKLENLQWRRYASGLHEPLAIAAPGGVIQVGTKNGVVRLHDRDGNGEADWFENFNDQIIQSQTTRSFPLDMAVAPDGSTFVTQGGIVTQSGIAAGGTGTSHAGAVLRIAPDGRQAEVFAEKAREPFLTVHPQTGMVTGTDQQGHYIPTSAVYLIRRGASFGFLEENPTRLTPPLVWIPHEYDSSSSSQVWLAGEHMGVWKDRLLHLSYGSGRLFIVQPDLEAPTPQGAVIPLDLKTDLPLLHARMHPRGDSVFLAGFQIWGTRAATPWALGRLRPSNTPISTAVGARSFKEGVILEFGQPLDPASVRPEAVSVRAWNYRRSAEYGSGRYTLDGEPGTVTLGVAQTIVSADRRHVFVHLPDFPATMQTEVRHDWQLSDGSPARGVAYFTVHEPASVDLAAAGFPNVDLTTTRVVVARQEQEPPSIERGRALAESLGCVGCHSADGNTEGQIGPTWRNLYGSTRTFVDGTTDVADEVYLREKILDPLKRRVTLSQAEMPSYRGVVTEDQLDALILYLKSLAQRQR